MSKKNSEQKIAEDEYKMSVIRKHKKNYHSIVEHMSEDERAVFDHGLMGKYDDLFGDTSAYDDGRG